MTPPLFLAVPLPETVAERLAGLAGGVPGARWVPARNMHVTLRYIGEVDGVLADDIAGGLAEVDGAAFDLTIDGVDVFGGRKDARVLYAGVAPKEPLKRLHEKIDALLRRLGVPAEERRYTPHVTLARLRRPPADRVGRFLEANGLLMSQPFRVEDFCLYASIRGSEGAVYHELHRYALHD